MSELPSSGDTATTFRPPRERLVRMLAISLVVHLAIFSVVLLAPRGGGDGRTVAFVDLTIPAASPPPVPAVPVPAPPKPQQVAEPVEKPVPAAAEPQAEEAPPAPAPAQPAAAGGTSISLGIGRGYFGSLGEGETLKDEIREYYFEMVKRFNERWWQRPEADDSRVGVVMVMVVLSRDGKVVNCQLMRSSGIRSYDAAIMAAVQAVSPLPPLPATFESDFFQAPLRVMPPLSLMRIGEGMKGMVLR